MAASPKKIARVKKFVDTNFSEVTWRSVSAGEEARFTCPFCHGGDSHEVSFDLNPHTGAARCWRASCGWRGSIEWFIHEYLDVPYPRAVEIVEGDRATTIEELNSSLNFLDEFVKSSYRGNEPALTLEDVSAWVDGSVPIDMAPEHSVSRVKAWIESVRGYVWEDFIKEHSLWIPPQYGSYKDRILFEIRGGESLGYLLYAMEPHIKPKTLNPHGRVLSRMLYRYDEIKNSRVIFVCEGFFDAARLTSFGFAATCVFSVYPSQTQIHLLSETDAEEIVIAFDAGTEALAKEAALKFSSYISDKSISFLRIDKRFFNKGEWKEGMDPDEMTEEQVVRLFKYRAKLLREEDKIRNKLDRLKKVANSGNFRGLV